MDDDFALALQLQSEFFDDQFDTKSQDRHKSPIKNGQEPTSLVDPYWELTDPNPDVRALFLQFNERFFWGRLAGIEVRWSPRMTLCAGLCCYEGRGGLCSVRLSVPLLKLRPRKDLVETLLHEMIHAYLFVTDNNKDHDGHGPEFHKHMYRINNETGTSISVYHNFHDEVDAYKTHWWLCDGPCQKRKPFFGHVKRSMNRAPGKNDTWWAEHQRTCGGTFKKIKEPEDYGKKSKKKDKEEKDKDKRKPSVKSMDIRVFGGKGKTLGQPKTGSTNNHPISNNRISTSSTNDHPTSSSTGSKTTKPTATVTSGALQGTSNHVVTLDSDSDNDGNHLPGSKTPAAKSGPKFKGSNKPVSQGGRQSFDKIKKKRFQALDFSDSEDDDEMCKLEEISMNEKNKVFGSGDNDMSKTEESEDMGNEMDNDFNRIDGEEESGMASNEIGSEHDAKNTVVEDTKREETDPGDVRAMLRKVWGEKQYNKVGSGSSKGNCVGGLSDIGSWSAGVKRASSESDNSVHRKKQKTSNKDNYMIHSASGNDQRSPNKTRDIKIKGSANVTSPIKDLFKKMVEKGNSVTFKKPENVTEIPNFGAATCDSSGNDQRTMRGGDSNSDTPAEAVELAPCPVCSKSIPSNTINDHLDLCLTLQAIG